MAEDIAKVSRKLEVLINDELKRRDKTPDNERQINTLYRERLTVTRQALRRLNKHH